MSYVFLSIVVAVAVVGQLVLKAGSARVTLDQGPATFVRSFLNGYLVVGYGLGLVGPIFYFLALRDTPLGIAYAFMALTSAFVALLAHLIWKEPLGRKKVVGIALIVSGNLLFALL